MARRRRARRRSGTRAGPSTSRCSTTWQEVFGLTLIQLGHSANTEDTAQLDEAQALLEQQKPLVRVYSTDTIATMTSGDVWIGHIWGADRFAIQETIPEFAYYIPEEGGIKGNDTIATFTGSPHPNAAQLFINHLLDAEQSAANTNLIYYMGPNEAAKEFIDPAILEDPTINPEQEIVDKLEELLALDQGLRDEYLSRWTGAPRLTGATREAAAQPPTTERSDPGRGPSPPRAPARGGAARCPASAGSRCSSSIPLAFIFVVSLGSRDELGRITLANPSLDNYAKAFNPVFLPTFLNSMRYAAITTVLSLAIGYPIAYWISRYGGRRKVLLLILVMLPFWTSYLIRTYSWTILLRDNGVVNSLLQAVGIIDQPIILMNTDLSVILGMVYGFLPFAILPLFVSIDRLDPNLVAAGRDLYASGRAAFRHVTLPLTMPGIIAAALLTFIPALGDFVTPGHPGRAADDDDREEHPGALPRRPGLAVRGGARVHPHGGDARSERWSRCGHCGARSSAVSEAGR